jgi:hypothetical protein
MMEHSGRRASRLRLAFPVLVESAGEVHRHTAEDVSEAGLLFLAAEPYALGTRLCITFSLPSTDVELVAEAFVRHVEWDGATPPGRFRVGVEFGRFEQGEIHPPVRCLPC